IHAALNRWAESDAVDATDPLQIKHVVERAFDEAVSETFDEEPLPAVKLQLEQARLRLKAFAEWQALHRRAGWQLKHYEKKASYRMPLPNGSTIEIHGRIDRVDYHPTTREWLIIDYKTGDAAEGPDKVHLQNGMWVDLQLPLYRLLAPDLGVQGEPGVAYVTLGKDPSGDPGDLLKPAKWSPDQLASADAEIRRIAEAVAAQDFWTPAKEPPRYDDFACILQEGVFGREAFTP
ncbi:MAG TPA: PD-(D/E)XK nuclease family protein, partial [Caulifigura sp.]|nr:PD-(D/E)XK nuclease family protein [Caulifigura sp.]